VKGGFLKDYLQEQQDDALVTSKGGSKARGACDLRRILKGRMHCLPAKEVQWRYSR